jgi:hypothetical protein
MEVQDALRDRLGEAAEDLVAQARHEFEQGYELGVVALKQSDWRTIERFEPGGDPAEFIYEPLRQLESDAPHYMTADEHKEKRRQLEESLREAWAAILEVELEESDDLENFPEDYFQHCIAENFSGTFHEGFDRAVLDGRDAVRMQMRRGGRQS